MPREPPHKKPPCKCREGTPTLLGRQTDKEIDRRTEQGRFGNHFMNELTASIAVVGFEPLKGDREFLEKVVQEEHDFRVRMRAITALGKLKDRRSRLILESAIDDPVHIIRLNSIFALGELSDRESTPILVRVLLSEDEIGIRLNAVTALGKIGDPRAIPYLEEALRREAYKNDAEKIRAAIERCQKK